MKKFFFIAVCICLSAITVFPEAVSATEVDSRQFLLPASDQPLPKTYLGVMTADDDQGARIVEVMNGSPAAKAGLQKDDIITSVDGKAIDGPERLAEVIESLKPDQKVQVEILRNDKKQTLAVVLGLTDADRIPAPRRFDSRQRNPFIPYRLEPFSYPLPQPYQRRPFNMPEWDARPELGLRIQDTEAMDGVKVLKVTKDSPADKAGVREGDVITGINGADINNVPDAVNQMRERDNRNYKLVIQRNKKSLVITVRVTKPLREADI